MNENLDLEQAREKCRELAARCVTPNHAQDSLYADGFETAVVREVTKEYYELYRVATERRRFRRRSVGAVVCVVCGFLFLVFLTFPNEDGETRAVKSLLVAATWGLLQALFAR